MQAVTDTTTMSWVTMPDGIQLAARDQPHAAMRGAVLIVHGLGEHSGRYQRLTQWFHARGYAVRSYDHRGHGQSEGRRGGLDRPDDLVDDLATVYNDYAMKLQRAPMLLGHSMGGLVAARCVLDGRIAPPAMMLSSPALRCHEPAWLQKLAGLLARTLPDLPLSNGLKLDKLSHDASTITDYRVDTLCHRRITPRLADFIFRSGATCIADSGRLNLPTLLLVSGPDALVDSSGSRDFAAGAWAGNHLTTRFFDTLYHELFNEAEPGRSQVLKQLGDWLQKLP